MQPQLDIALFASPFCFLNREEKFTLTLGYRFHYRETIAIDTDGSIFDPAATFVKNRIEVSDTITGETVHFAFVQENPAKEDRKDSFILKPEVGSYFLFTTTVESPKRREYPFEIANLGSNRRYTVAYRDHGISQWSSQSQPTAQPGDSIQVNLIGNRHPQFSTRDAMRPPPPVTAALSPETPICDLSGALPFTVILTWKLNSTRPIYALITQAEGFKIGLEIRDPEKNGRRIGPPPDLGPEEDGATSNDEDILVILDDPAQWFSQAYTFQTKERRNGVTHSDTWNVKSGKKYELMLRKRKWRWIYQDEIEVAVPVDRVKVEEALRQEPYSQWKPECRAEFQAQ